MSRIIEPFFFFYFPYRSPRKRTLLDGKIVSKSGVQLQAESDASDSEELPASILPRPRAKGPTIDNKALQAESDASDSEELPASILPRRHAKGPTIDDKTR